VLSFVAGIDPRKADMSSNKTRRLTTAVGFVSGVLACMDAVRDATILWPPSAMWQALSHPHRLEFGAGIALILVTLAVAAWQPSS
jgi:hypothetical protein